jgi:iron complex transport system substrate-binding protein
MLRSDSISDIENNIMLIGKITQHITEAQSLVGQINSTIQYITEKLQNVPAVTVMEVAGPPEYGIWSAGADTYFNQVIQVAGGINVFNNETGWYNPSGEEILSTNPQYILVDSMTLSGYTTQDIINWFDTQPGFGNVSAVTNNNIYVLYGQAANAVERPGPRIIDMLELYAYILHPSIFGTSLPNGIGDNYTDYVR